MRTEIGKLLVELLTLSFHVPLILPPCTTPESRTLSGTSPLVPTPTSQPPASHGELSVVLESTLITPCGGFGKSLAGVITTPFSSTSIGMPPLLALVGVMVTGMGAGGGTSKGPLAGSDSLDGTSKEVFAFSPLSRIIFVTVDG